MANLTLVGHITALLTIIVWGITFVSTKILLEDFSPFEILFMRFLLGWLALWMICPKPHKYDGWRLEMVYAAAGLSGISLYFLLENVALTLTFASNVAIIVTTAPFFTALLAWWFLKGARPGAGFLAGFFLAIAGVALISGNGAALSLNPLGDAMALGAALAWAVYSILMRQLVMRGKGSLGATRHVFFYGLLFMLPLMGQFSPDFRELLAPRNYLNLLFLGLLASAACFASWTFAIKILGAVAASLYIYLVPVVTLLAAAIVLDERLTPISVAGIILVISGLVIAETRPLSRKGRKLS